MTKIILIGYMGCGKSTIAKKLSEKIQIPCFDLDNLIETKSDSSISQIFKEKGEVYFRKLEHNFFYAFMQSPETAILSLGGGTPCYANNHELLKGENVVSVYLNASVDTLYNRLIFEKENRPIIAQKNDDELKEFIAKQLFERSFYYYQAQYKVTVDEKTTDMIVSEIEKLLA